MEILAGSEGLRKTDISTMFGKLQHADDKINTARSQ